MKEKVDNQLPYSLEIKYLIKYINKKLIQKNLIFINGKKKLTFIF